MKARKKKILIFAIFALIFSSVLNILPPNALTNMLGAQNISEQSTFAASSSTASEYICGDGHSHATFLGIRRWCSNIQIDPDFSNDQDGSKMARYIAQIALNITQMLLGISSYVALGFVLAGGILSIVAQDNASKAIRARKFIKNALIGLVIMRAASLLVDIVADIADIFNRDHTSVGMIAVELSNELYFWAGSVALIMLIIAGLVYSSSAGNTAKLAKAKKTIITSTTGLSLIIIAATATNIVYNNFNYTNENQYPEGVSIDSGGSAPAVNLPGQTAYTWGPSYHRIPERDTENTRLDDYIIEQWLNLRTNKQIKDAVADYRKNGFNYDYPADDNCASANAQKEIGGASEKCIVKVFRAWYQWYASDAEVDSYKGFSDKFN